MAMPETSHIPSRPHHMPVASNGAGRALKKGIVGQGRKPGELNVAISGLPRHEGGFRFVRHWKPLQAAGHATAVLGLSPHARLTDRACNNPAWLVRIPDVATELIFGGSPSVSTA